MVFAAGTPAGEAALALAHGGAWLYLEDTQLQPPPFWWDEEPAYRTRLAGPVAAGSQVRGLLDRTRRRGQGVIARC